MGLLRPGEFGARVTGICKQHADQKAVSWACHLGGRYQVTFWRGGGGESLPKLKLMAISLPWVKTHWHQPLWMGWLPLWIKQPCDAVDLDFWSLIHWATQFMMKSWCFLHYWHFVRRNHWWPVDFPHKGLVTQALMFFYVSLNKLLNKQSIFQWFKMPWHSHHVTVMIISLSGAPDYFGRNKISSGGDLSHYSRASLY